MSKMKQLVILFLITLMIVIGIHVSSNAADIKNFNVNDVEDYTVGTNVYINENIMYNHSNNKMYCVEHNQVLPKSLTKYTLKSKITIVGNTSTDHRGKSITNKLNARLVGILASGKHNDRNQMRNAIWNFIQTWMNGVGKNHYGLTEGFSSAVKGSPVALDQEAIDYMNSISKDNTKIEDKTDSSKIKVKLVDYNNAQYTRVGPFRWSFSGKLSSISAYGDSENPIQGVLYSQYDGTEQKMLSVRNIDSGKNFYIYIPVNAEVSGSIRLVGNMDLELKKADVWFFKSSVGMDQNLIYFEPGTDTVPIEGEFVYDEIPPIKNEGDLKIIKVDADDQTIKLNNVGFVVQRKEDNTYVYQDAQGNISYKATREEATEFVTVNGEITIRNLLLGNYIIYETKNPNYGYEISTTPIEVEVVANETTNPTVTTIQNTQSYIKLSGYVWLDLKPDIKDTTQDINELYKDNNEDNTDVLVEGVTVRLKVGNTVVQETRTDGNGAYYFENVEVRLLDSYYIEFEYDGLRYENVVPRLDKDNGSKAIEGTDGRRAFNNRFASIEGNKLNSTSDTITTGVSKDAAGNVTNNLSYNKYYADAGDNSYTSRFINNGSYVITANTASAGFNLREARSEGALEIRNINLGMKERAQADIAILKDLSNAKVTINGYEHTYYYEQALELKEDESYSGEGLNVGIRFGTSTVNQSYTRAIYSSDVNYNQENGDDRELKVYLTYKIGLKNNENLVTRVNSILEYYDARYELVKAGATIDANGNISSELTPDEANRAMDSGNVQYKKAIIQTNKDVQGSQTEYIYVQFQLNRDAVLSILDKNGDGIVNENDGENTDNLLNNFTEINSYTVYKDGEIYAAIDKNSNPGNSIPGEEVTIEDDTDRAPALRLVTADARTMQGKVFLDETTGELRTDEIREGNGQLDDNEIGISGVKLTLTETSGTNLVYDGVTTGEDGTFTISNFIPGRYTLTYTWGDSTYTVQDYKGTIYKDQSRSQNQEWYKTLDPRLSDATDNWDTRKAIDEETANKVEDRTITTMDSTTPTMSLAIEYEAIYTASRGDKYEYKVQNVDFGIVERARQQLSLDKHVKAIRIVSQGGETLVDGTLVNGRFEGQVQGLTGGPDLGYVRVTMDNELIQGSTAYITYEMTLTNSSERDYYTEDGYYYLYGYEEAVRANKLGELVRIRVGQLNDYLDNTLIYNEENGIWEVTTQDDGNGKTILVTDEFVNQELQPTQQASVELPTSKLLSVGEETVFNNEAEVIESTPIPYGRQPNNPKDASEETLITRHEGGNRDYVLPITIGISTLIILGAGIIFIKKKVLHK